MGGQTTNLGTLRQLPGTRISLGGAIRAASPVPLEFPTYRGGRAPEPRRDPAYRSTRGNPARDLLTLLQPQRHRRAPTCCGGNASIQSQYAVHAALVPSLERSRNVGYTLTVPPAVPKLGLLLRREPRPCVPLHTHTSSSGKIRRCCVDRLNPPSKPDVRERQLSAKSRHSPANPLELVQTHKAAVRGRRPPSFGDNSRALHNRVMAKA